MIVEVASFLASIGGSIDSEYYLRPIPGRPGYAAYCRKPQYSKLKKKEMAKSDNALHFSQLQSEAKRQYNDPVLREEWRQKHRAALRAASKQSHPIGLNAKPRVPYRLWDYIRHELSLQQHAPEQP